MPLRYRDPDTGRFISSESAAAWTDLGKHVSSEVWHVSEIGVSKREESYGFYSPSESSLKEFLHSLESEEWFDEEDSELDLEFDLDDDLEGYEEA